MSWLKQTCVLVEGTGEKRVEPPDAPKFTALPRCFWVLVGAIRCFQRRLDARRLSEVSGWLCIVLVLMGKSRRPCPSEGLGPIPLCNTTPPRRPPAFQGKFTKADPLFCRAVEIGEKALGPDNPALTTSLSNRAWSLEMQVRAVRYNEKRSGTSY